MAPLVLVGVPVAEIILTLLLSLRFINLVFDEASLREFFLDFLVKLIICATNECENKMTNQLIIS